MKTQYWCYFGCWFVWGGVGHGRWGAFGCGCGCRCWGPEFVWVWGMAGTCWVWGRAGTCWAACVPGRQPLVAPAGGSLRCLRCSAGRAPWHPPPHTPAPPCPAPPPTRARPPAPARPPARTRSHTLARPRPRAQAGHHEVVVARVQALVELHCFAPLSTTPGNQQQPQQPQQPQPYSHGAALRMLEAFWESGAARAGEEGARGWAAWFR